MVNIPYMDGKGMKNTLIFCVSRVALKSTTLLEVVADVKIIGNFLDDFKPFLILGLQDPSESGILGRFVGSNANHKHAYESGAILFITTKGVCGSGG